MEGLDPLVFSFPIQLGERTSGWGRDSQRLVSSPSPSSFAATLPAPYNSRKALPYLGGASDLRVPSKVKAEADAVEIDRTQRSGITLSQETKVLQTASS